MRKLLLTSCFCSTSRNGLGIPQSIGWEAKSICMLLGQSDFNCTNRISEAFILMNRQWMLYRYSSVGCRIKRI